MTDADSPSDAAANFASTLTDVELFNLKRAVKLALSENKDLNAADQEKLADFIVDGTDPSCLLQIGAKLNTVKPSEEKVNTGFWWQSSNPRRDAILPLFHQTEVTRGYFSRLGECLLLHPDIANRGVVSSTFEDYNFPSWLRATLLVYQALMKGDYDTYTEFPLPLVTDCLTDNDKKRFVEFIVRSPCSVSWEASNLLSRSLYLALLFEQEPETLTNALKSAPDFSASHILFLLFVHHLQRPEKILPTIMELATVGGKMSRPRAWDLLLKHSEVVQSLLKEQLRSSAGASRKLAVAVLNKHFGSNLETELRSALSVETNTKLQQAIKSLLAQIESEKSQGASEVTIPTLPPIEFPQEAIPLPDGFREALRKQVATAFEYFQKYYEKNAAIYNSAQRPIYMSKPTPPDPVSDEDQEKLCAYLEGTGPAFRIKSSSLSSPFCNSPERWLNMRGIHLLHIARLMHAIGYIDSASDRHQFSLHLLLAHRKAQESPYGLREMDAALQHVVGRRGLLVKKYLGYENYAFGLEDEAVWPLFYENTDALREAITGITNERELIDSAYQRRNAIIVAGKLPLLPKPIENLLWIITLGEAKTDRQLARQALRKVPERLQRGLAALEDSKQTVRIAGIELLVDVGSPEAIESLKKALKNEKVDAVKGSLLHAIEILGGDVEEFLGRHKQLADAKKVLEAKLPKGMDWFPLDALPEIHWADDNSVVAPEIVRAWIITSVRFKLVACGALLRRAMQMCRPDDTAALAKFVLSAWISRDTQPSLSPEVVTQATEQARREFNTHSWLKDIFKTEEEYRDSLIRAFHGKFKHSAIGEKGILAVVAAGGDKHCVRTIEKYVRTYHGQRLAQSKALLEVLGWIDDPLAVQVLLSISNRFRTASIRKHAANLVKGIAERKGWTREQLADRTIPDAGFASLKDEKGNNIGKRATLVLSYGARKFNVIINDDLEVVISREDGKDIKSLPAATKNDDPALVKTAKSEFKAAKKTVKEVVKLVAEQLYEAVCNQREWSGKDWKNFLASHPIAGVLCRRVVWCLHPLDQPNSCRFFRPLEDGTYTDVHDDSVEVSDLAVIKVAHSSLMTRDDLEAWMRHLQDYDVPQLFKQFGRGAYTVPEGEKDNTQIEDFKGHMLTTFLLRNKAIKLGWQRGTPQTGGSFGNYFKTFRSSKITANLEFTGSYLPESDIPAAIVSLSFFPLSHNQTEGDMWPSFAIQLQKVPPILLNECYNDVRDIAAEGSGFDPEWQKKGLW